MSDMRPCVAHDLQGTPAVGGMIKDKEITTAVIQPEVLRYWSTWSVMRQTRLNVSVYVHAWSGPRLSQQS